MDDGLHIVDRDSPEWRRAWAALIATGEDPEDYMLMHASEVWSFKHKDSRQYFEVRSTA